MNYSKLYRSNVVQWAWILPLRLFLINTLLYLLIFLSHRSVKLEDLRYDCDNKVGIEQGSAHSYFCYCDAWNNKNVKARIITLFMCTWLSASRNRWSEVEIRYVGVQNWNQLKYKRCQNEGITQSLVMSQ